MADELEHLLNTEPLRVPERFAASVMARIEELPLPDFPAPPTRAERRLSWLQGMALAGSAILGAVQLGAFILGIWAASTVG